MSKKFALVYIFSTITSFLLISAALADVLPPSQPIVTSLTNTSAVLSWTAAPSSTETQYAILQSTDGVNFTPVANGCIAAPATTTLVSNLAPNTPYTFQIVASDGIVSTSSLSSVAVYTLPNPPSAISVITSSPNSVALSFAAPNNSVGTLYGFRVQPAGGTSFWVSPTSTATSTNPILGTSSEWGSPVTIGNLFANTTYTVLAEAYNTNLDPSGTPMSTFFSTTNYSVALAAVSAGTTALQFTVTTNGGANLNYTIIDQRFENNSITNYYLQPDHSFNTSTVSSTLSFADIASGSPFVSTGFLPNSPHKINLIATAPGSSINTGFIDLYTSADLPTNITTISTTTSITINWTGNATQYHVTIRGTPNFDPGWQTSTSYVYQNPSCNGTFPFALQGLNGDSKVYTDYVFFSASTPDCPAPISGGGGGGGGGGFAAPTVDGVITAPGATVNQIVLFSVTSTSAMDVMFSEDSKFVTSTGWLPLTTPSYAFGLSPFGGVKTVYAKFRNSVGVESGLHSISILYTPPAGVAPVVLGMKITTIDTLLGTLKLGSKNNQVLVLQQMLQQQGYLPKNFKPTTYFGLSTQNAITAYKKAAAAKVALATKAVTPQTISSTTLTTLIKQVKYGTHDVRVKTIQTELIKLNLFPKGYMATDFYGPLTRDAIKKYQSTKL